MDTVTAEKAKLAALTAMANQGLPPTSNSEPTPGPAMTQTLSIVLRRAFAEPRSRSATSSRQ